ncbi:MAG: 2-oxoacid:ferredoxin oxidoreductase subunit beta [Candidatus Syntropharchaeia archaeon]
MEIFEFFRRDRWPHMFCPGCGNGIVMNCIQRAFSDAEINIDRTVFVSGIGCSSRIPGYISADSLHTLHGRAIAFATGVKLGNPDLEVIVITGDGDLGAIGGNHFINACRRNMDLTVICINNSIYGMTGGQVSTGTPHGFKSSTTPKGNPEYPFDFSAMAATLGANFVARWTVAHVKQLTKSIKLAIEKDGFSFVEAISPCPTYFGRQNKMGDPIKIYRWIKENSVRIEKMKKESCINVDEKITIGIFRDADRKSYLGRGNENRC